MLQLATNEVRMTTPVLITAFRRPDFLARVLDVFQSRDNPIFVWLNGAKDDSDMITIARCQEIISQSKAHVVCVKSNIEHFASGQSIINAIDWIFSLQPRAIILEDDIIVGDDFLDFMELALLQFEPMESGVGSILGSYFLPDSSDQICCVRSSVFTSSWGWGTWRDRWNLFERNLADWEEHKHLFPRIVQDFPSRKRFENIFNSIRNGQFDAWDYRWQYTNWKNGWISIGPTTNLVLNIGFDHRSTHTFVPPVWVPRSIGEFNFREEDLRKFPTETSGDKWYKENVLGLSYSYYLKTEIRKIVSWLSNMKKRVRN